MRPAPSIPLRSYANVLAQRVLVLTPVPGDADAVAHALELGGFGVRVCEDVTDISVEAGRDAFRGAGAVILAQEALTSGLFDEHARMARILANQPEWSDLPLILLANAASGEDEAWEIARGLDPVGNITILERPLRRTTLLNAVAVALRARSRQYELRTMLGELTAHRSHLEQLIARKTAELAQSSASLQHAERLASLGNLAAGLGHDIANLALPIRVRLDSLRAANPSSDARADCDAIDLALTHLTQLSAGMRLMAIDPAREAASAAATDLAAWADELMPMLRAVLPRHVRVEKHIPPGLGVNVPRHRLAQAVFNLVQNAGEAMAVVSGGTVRLSAQPAQRPGRRPMVHLYVSDDGPGMTNEVRDRCFEPYFSTKGRSISTGMGLSMVKGIVESAQGAIDVQSTVGKGTTFIITIPAAENTARIASTAPNARRGAVTVANDRTANLARMFMEHLEITSERHAGPTAPSAPLWVLDYSNTDQIAAYLAQDRTHHAVVLAAPESNGLTALALEHPEVTGRVHILPPSPTASDLRSAITSATRN